MDSFAPPQRIAAMCLPTQPNPDGRPDEDPVLVFAGLVIEWRWKQEELSAFGVQQCDFCNYVARMRESLVGEGLIEERV
jgi:hypothetical protein